MSNYPSIFNDVIGPVMRGPSSSHCAASLRIARLCRDLMDHKIKDILIEFAPDGSLATTHKSQGSDMGLFGGFLGWDASDERLPQSESYLANAGIQVEIRICDIKANHPNTYKLNLSNEFETRHLTAISTGGGMIEVISIDGAAVSMWGDYFETLIYCQEPESLLKYIKANIQYDDLVVHKGLQTFIEIKSQSFPNKVFCDELSSIDGVYAVKFLNPVLPVMARKNLTVPFITCNQMLVYNESKNKRLWELAVDYESERGNITAEEVFEKMRAIVRIMGNAIELGLKGTHYEDRILGSQSLQFREKMAANKLVDGDVNNRVILYVSAMMEVKSSMSDYSAQPETSRHFP